MGASPRERRLASDYRCLAKLKSLSSIVDFEAEGKPPDRYLVTFRGKGIGRNKQGEIKIVERHVCEVRLGASYPRSKPDLAWKTPIYHPNISESGMVCLGGYSMSWVPSLQLDELSEMLWDMIRFANYDTRSAYNYAAAKWLLTQREFALPTDARPLRDRVASGEVKLEDKDMVSVKTEPRQKAKKPADTDLLFIDEAATSGEGDDVLVIKDGE